MTEKLFNPDYLLHLCKKYNLNPSKQYGQNYLIDQSVIEHILEIADLKKTDTVIEVGPGFGVLTLPLAERVEKVTSFEIERKLEAYWEEQTNKFPNIAISWGNVLKELPMAALPRQYKVVANLPYQITSPVIQTLLAARPQPAAMILMVQKEVGERITAKPGDLSVLGLAVQYYADVDYLFTVPRSAFWPSPAVDSAVIKIVPRAEQPDPKLEKRLFELAHAGFANRRKLLIKNLLPIIGKEHKTELEQTFIDLGLNLQARAQELSVGDWQSLVKRFP